MTIAERYATANNASSLKLKPDSTGPVDVIIAAGLSPSLLGGYLRRLQSEYDGASKQGGSQTDAMLLASSLKSLRRACEGVSGQATRNGVDKPLQAAMAVIFHWLDDTCGRCHGAKFEVIEGTGRTSAKPCKRCHGTGKSPVPWGEQGKALRIYMDQCYDRAVASSVRRLRG